MILLRPVDAVYPITQNYGENPALYPLTNGHNGIDYGTPEGTRIKAAADGVVVEASDGGQDNYGVHVVLSHAGGKTIYGHGQPGGLLVKVGDRVTMGQEIMISGNTGRSTGPHLHFEYRPGTSNIAVDPAPFVVDQVPGGNWMVEITTDALNMRTGPSVERGRVGSLKNGDRVQLIGVGGLDVWLHVVDDQGRDGWIAMRLNGGEVWARMVSQ